MALAFEYYFPQVLNCNSDKIVIQNQTFPNPIGHLLSIKQQQLKQLQLKQLQLKQLQLQQLQQRVQLEFYEIELENNLIGIVIGVGGCTIQKIRKESGASIKIDDKIKNGKRKIKITGKIQSMNIAKEKIMSRIQ
jgi:polyribonucleotide nucleotidyltransferase